MTSQSKPSPNPDSRPPIPLPDIEDLVAMLQLALDSLRAKLPTGTSPSGSTYVRLFDFITHLTYQETSLDPRVIAYFLRGLKQIRPAGELQDNYWEITRKGVISKMELAHLIRQGRVPREHVKR